MIRVVVFGKGIERSIVWRPDFTVFVLLEALELEESCVARIVKGEKQITVTESNFKKIKIPDGSEVHIFPMYGGG